jgi:hypothetical protein
VRQGLHDLAEERLLRPHVLVPVGVPRPGLGERQPAEPEVVEGRVVGQPGLRLARGLQAGDEVDPEPLPGLAVLAAWGSSFAPVLLCACRRDAPRNG